MVTVGARGIGAAAVRSLVASGARVVVGDVNQLGLEALRDMLGEAVVVQQADATREDDVRALVEAAMTTWGRLDVLHNNAAVVVAEDVDVVGTTDAAWRAAFDSSVMAAVWGMRHAIPAMIAGGGSVITMSSGSAVIASAVKVAYGSFKAATETLTMYAAAHYGSHGVRCNVVRPGFVLTEGIREALPQEQIDQRAVTSAMGRNCTPEDVAEVVASLASPASAYVNGQVAKVNGGGEKPVTAW